MLCFDLSCSEMYHLIESLIDKLSGSNSRGTQLSWRKEWHLQHIAITSWHTGAAQPSTVQCCCYKEIEIFQPQPGGSRYQSLVCFHFFSSQVKTNRAPVTAGSALNIYLLNAAAVVLSESTYSLCQIEGDKSLVCQGITLELH